MAAVHVRGLIGWHPDSGHLFGRVPLDRSGGGAGSRGSRVFHGQENLFLEVEIKTNEDHFVDRVEKFKEAFKTGLAMMLVYGIAL